MSFQVAIAIRLGLTLEAFLDPDVVTPGVHAVIHPVTRLLLVIHIQPASLWVSVRLELIDSCRTVTVHAQTGTASEVLQHLSEQVLVVQALLDFDGQRPLLLVGESIVAVWLTAHTLKDQIYAVAVEPIEADGIPDLIAHEGDAFPDLRLVVDDVGRKAHALPAAHLLGLSTIDDHVRHAFHLPLRQQIAFGRYLPGLEPGAARQDLTHFLRRTMSLVDLIEYDRYVGIFLDSQDSVGV